MVSWLHFGKLGRIVAQLALSILVTLRASRAVPWLPAMGKQSVSCKGEHTGGWTYSDVNDWDRGLGLNWRIKLSNRTDVAFFIFKACIASLTPDVSSSSKYTTLWNCSAGTILFLSLFLLLIFHLFYLLPSFFLSSPISFDFLAQKFVLSLFFFLFSGPHCSSTSLPRNFSVLLLCLPPCLTNSHPVLHFLVVPALDSNTAPNSLLMHNRHRWGN